MPEWGHSFIVPFVMGYEPPDYQLCDCLTHPVEESVLWREAKAAPIGSGRNWTRLYLGGAEVTHLQNADEVINA